KHSPIVGWMQDGYPLYGPYGYANPTNAASGVKRLVSGFALRNGQPGTDDLRQLGRQSLPAWAVRVEHLTSSQLSAGQTGPTVNATFPLGHYIEDYAYLGDGGKTQGRDFDLDELNGRWCVTPEFPQGTYAYFTTIDDQGLPAYPYNMGRRYHGNPVGRLVSRIGEPVSTNFVARVTGDTRAATAAPAETLSWNPAGAGQYQRQQP
ncbi:MAG TPA: YHYH protein, partial [Verrucomicrobiae bacterium]